MNRRRFLLNMRTAAVAGCAFSFAHGAAAQHLRPVTPPQLPTESPRLRVAQGAETPVVLQALRVEVEVSGSRALTTVEMTFFNPNRRVLEGELQFPLLDGQQVVGFALDIDGSLREAVPVDKVTGRQVFEDVIRTRVDPALLEATAGNNYKLRVYPLPPQGTRRVLLRYAESLAVAGALRRYRLPLDYARALSSFQLRVTVRAPAAAPRLTGKFSAGDGGSAPQFQARGADYEVEIARRDYTARGMLEIFLPASTRAEVRTQTVDGRTYFLAEVPLAVAAIPDAGAALRKLPGSVGIVWDASGSGALRDHAREFALLDAYFQRMGSGEVRLVRVRDTAEAAQVFRIAGGDWRALRRALEATDYDGATQLAAATLDGAVGEWLLFSDGLDNFGERHIAISSTSAASTVPVYPVNSALRADHARLRVLAEGSGGRYIDMTAVSAAEAVRRLLDAAPRIVELKGQGLTALTTASRFADDGRWLIAGELQAASGTLSIGYIDPRHPLQPQSRAGLVIRRIEVRAADSADTQAAHAWAGLRMAELDGAYRANRAEIRRLGLAFGIPSRETSLIVLDHVEDYVRHGIAPPPELRAEYDRQRANLHLHASDERKRQLERVKRMLDEKAAWWARDFPKAVPAARIAAKKSEAEDSREGGALRDRAARPSRRETLAAEPPRADRGANAASVAPAQPAAAPAIGIRGFAGGRLAEAAAAAAAAAPAPAGISIQLKRWTPDAPYVRRFAAASRDDLYHVYLEERKNYLDSTAFFLDAADVFFERGLTALGVRVLGNLAEMNLENRHILRILGYRLMQAGQPALAVPVLRRVLALAPDEPQSYRDLGLAHAANRQWQQAADQFYEVVIRPWHGRFPEIELTALDELNALIATADAPVDTSRFDARLLRNLPVDLRVAMSWDADNTDIDLWVTDPNGEKAYYGNRLTYQGGRMSLDYTGGYGPETFSLKRAKPGKYKVEANFYGHNQQIVAGATTLQLKLITHFGTREAQEQVVTLRLKGRSEVVQVGEFEVAREAFS